MAKYIDLEAFLKDAERRYCLPCKGAGKDYNGVKCRACWVDDMMGDVDDAPAADVAPVVHTRWAHIGGDEWCCPACGFVITTEGSWDKPIKKYCENCGAKMDGDADNGKIDV